MTWSAGPQPGEPQSDRQPTAAGWDAAELLAAEVIGVMTGRGETLAVAESLTGGLVSAALTSIPGSSLVFRGGIVAYASDLKAALLAVSEELIAEHGPVHPDVAAEMAVGVQTRLGATFGLSTTGVAGPGPADGQPAGTVFAAVAGPGGVTVSGLELPGNRWEVRMASVQGVLSLLVSALREDIS